MTYADLTDEEKREIAGMSQEYRQDIKDGVISQMCGRTLSGTVNIAEGVEQIDPYKFYYTQIERANLPGTLLSIGAYAFANCSRLSVCDLPNGVTNIGDFAFHTCPFREVIMPKQLFTLGTQALLNLPNVEFFAVSPGISAAHWANPSSLTSAVFKLLVYTGPAIFLYTVQSRIRQGVVLLYDGVCTIAGQSGSDTASTKIYVPDGLYDDYQATADSSWTAQRKARLFRLSEYTDEGGNDFIRRVKEKYGMA